MYRSFEVPNEEELQRTTINRNTSLGFDYSPSRNWGINVQLPYFDRWHSTLAEDTDALSYSHSRGIGDVRVVGRYQGFNPDAGFGVLFGLKLPTGATDIDFNAGPEEGERLDAGLAAWHWHDRCADRRLPIRQSESGLGLLRPGAASATAEQPRRISAPAPGSISMPAFATTAGGFSVPQLQLNVRSERRESGANADVANSGAPLPI